ncbi:hypothetical protein [Hymenobacter cavernae]|uniref:Rieske domain-containing protein n=1 Tax=Hymenobacter cavernae TaxID=2044852 RepID=A0ABQ1TRT8_9BACT|nr:hypothetical protein [Hymenobacter cavernae]GGF00594.1 hypothetical protein GCM10011383_09250 [Hymenobacter cavernae]
MRTSKNLGLLSTVVLLGSFLVACGDSGSDVQPQIPIIAFTTTISLLDQQNTALRFDNGVQYVDGGLKGLIVVRQKAGSYLAFERTCPYRPTDACALVSIDPSRLFLADTCCTSQFSIQGQVQGGPSRYPLRQYATSLNGNLLTISN